MKTKRNLERLAEKAGAKLEEDTGYRTMRSFQIVAPDGKQWVDGGVSCIRVEWAMGTSPGACKHNESEFSFAEERVNLGLEPATE